MRPGGHSRETGHVSDSNEKKKLRLEAARDAAKQLIEAQQKRLEKMGYTREQILQMSKKVDEVADFLYHTRPQLLDKLAERNRRVAEAIAGSGRSGSSGANLGSLGKQALAKLASDLKGLIPGNDHSSPGKSTTTDAPKTTSEKTAEKHSTRAAPVREAGKAVSDAKPLSTGKMPTEGTSRKTTPKEQTDVKMLRDAVKLARKRIESSPTTPNDGIRDPRRLPKEVNLYEPSVHGKRPKSYGEFEDLVNREYTGMKDIKDFSRMMEDVRKHYRLRELIGDRKTLEYGEVARLAKEIGKDFGTTRDWTLKEKPFKMAELLEGAISKSEATEIIRKLKEANNGVMSLDEAKRRIGNYYAGKEYENSKNYPRDLQNAVKYEKFIHALSEGGLITDISRKAGTHSPEGRAWSEGLQPWMIKLASSIPSEQPREGHLWLPLTTGSKNRPSDFIEVPIRVESHQDVQKVLENLKPLQSRSMTDSMKRFGPTTKEDSFMYALGVLLSDGHARMASDSNLAGSQFQLGLGRKYAWSIGFGDGTCYHLGMLGIRANRVADSDHKPGSSSYPSSGSHAWTSENSPLVTWMRRSGLGIPDGNTKTSTPIDAKWILSAPENWRLQFLRGVCDGDGCASLKAQYISIATNSNTDFLIEFLNKLGMRSHRGDTAVGITAQGSILRAEQLGIFKYAEERAANLKKMGEMIRTWDNSRPINEEQERLIRSLREDGFSWGRISERIYDEYGYSWRYDVIMRRMRARQNDGAGSGGPLL